MIAEEWGMSFNDDPLDLLEDDGDGVGEMCLIFDDEGENKHNSQKSPHGTGCSLVLFLLGMGTFSAGFFLTKLLV